MRERAWAEADLQREQAASSNRRRRSLVDWLRGRRRS